MTLRALVPSLGVRRRNVVVGCGYVALSLILHLPGMLAKNLTSDEATVGTVARALNNGSRLYRDVADRKPPIVPYVYASAFRVFGTADIRVVRLVGAIVLAAVAGLLAKEASRRNGSVPVGIACGVLFLLAYASFAPDDSQTATFELFMLLPMTAAVIVASRGRPLSAGLLLGVACLCKQTAITAIIPILFLLLRNQQWRWRWRNAWLVAVGTAIPIVMAGLLFGMRDYWLWTVAGNGGYLAYSGSVLGTALRGLGMTAFVMGTNAVIVLLAVLAALYRRASADLWLWACSAMISVGAGLRFFGHYYLQVLPALALIAAGALPVLKRSAWRWAALGATGSAVIMTTLGFLPLGDNASIPFNAISSGVRGATTRKDTVFVWGDMPEAYFESGRNPATRFVRTGFLTGNSGGRTNGSGSSEDGIPGAWTMLETDLEAHPPDLIVDTSTTPYRQANYYPLAQSVIGNYVAANYHAVKTVNGVELLRRNLAS
jgi:hypothetical protein